MDMEVYSWAAHQPAKSLVRPHLRMAVNKPHGLRERQEERKFLKKAQGRDHNLWPKILRWEARTQART